MTEAEAHPGVSLVIAYAPCALQGPDGGMSKSQTDAKMAVDTGERPPGPGAPPSPSPAPRPHTPPHIAAGARVARGLSRAPHSPTPPERRPEAPPHSVAPCLP
jgi:hypothetical protein